MAKKYPGYLISLEGPEGGGKTTYLYYLKDSLAILGIHPVILREPGSTLIGEQIRNVLFNPANSEIVNRTEVLLYQAARAQVVDEKIIPALNNGDVVVLDRYIDSSVAYQGYARGLGCSWISKINDWSTCGITPDLTVLFDVDSATALERKKRQGEWNWMDALPPDFHKDVRYAYLILAETDTEGRWEYVDASKKQNVVEKNVTSIILNRLKHEGFIRDLYAGREREG